MLKIRHIANTRTVTGKCYLLFCYHINNILYIRSLHFPAFITRSNVLMGILYLITKSCFTLVLFHSLSNLLFFFSVSILVFPFFILRR